MAACEKRRAAAPPVAAAARELDSEAEFLLQAGVSAMVREALLKVLEARPEEPVAFLADYFEKLELSGAGGEAGAEPPGLPQRLARALWYVRLAHHSHRPAFSSNVALAYECLSGGGRRRRAGLDGRLFSELLRRVCRPGPAPAEAVSALLRKVQCREHEAVPLDVFRYGVLSCAVLREFAAKAGALYDALGGGGPADKRLCQAVLRALEEALADGDLPPPARYLAAGAKLGPDGLALAMERALRERKLSAAMSREEFLRKAAALFVAKVKAVE
ncbi:tubulin polyglutamylase complex subunit 1 [Nothoprocta perdicaria]|uniref:tubulin polyglutamylase complex subunit 1 n=1 Tax=Nothoprocta perdicaria TaxID=30464 RepID=UPI000E1B9384|nr:tubulin polyglutamylase complex subunit 1 [Nothoprocta perdicaria]